MADSLLQGQVKALKEGFGFITPSEPLPLPYTNKDVHFRFQDVLRRNPVPLAVGDTVFFVLKHGTSHAKPAAYIVHIYWQLPSNRQGRETWQPHGRSRSSDPRSRRTEGALSKRFSNSTADLSASQPKVAKDNVLVDIDIDSVPAPGQTRMRTPTEYATHRTREESPETEEGRFQHTRRVPGSHANSNQAYHTRLNKRDALSSSLPEGTVVGISGKSGFIKPDRKLPEGYKQDKDIFFDVSRAQTGHLQLMQGDKVVFSLGTKDKNRPMAFSVTLRFGRTRNVEVITKYIDEVAEIVGGSNEEIEGSKRSLYVVSVLSCLAVWDCIGRCTGLSSETIQKLLEMLVQLENDSKSMSTLFGKALQALSHTPFLSPSKSCLKEFICASFNFKNTAAIVVLRKFFLILIQHVPEKTRAIVSFLKPVIDTNPHSTEYVMYSILKAAAKLSPGNEEDMEWDELPLIPTTSELLAGPLESEANLRPVMAKGSYKSAHDYLDVYFRLLRADCFEALKKGTRDFLSGTLDPRDMNIYHSVELVGIHLTKQENSLALGLKVTPHKKVLNWATSSNLMFGNLLCISPNATFRDPIWATVSNRSALKTNQVVVVELCTECNSISDSDAVLVLENMKGHTIMAESPTYYRAYQPVLNSLQKLEPEDIPFLDELVHVDRIPKVPQFLVNHPEATLDGGIIYTGAEQISVAFENDELSPASTKLDVSQESAVKHTLMNRIAIIQGPPGTGKTFVGVQLVKLLLSMSCIPKAPILLLTYKNHALDEFLKGLLNVGITQIVRLGGRSQDPALEKYNMNEVRKRTKMSGELFKLLKGYEADLFDMRQKVEEAFETLQKARSFSSQTLINNLTLDQIGNLLRGSHIWKRLSKEEKSREIPMSVVNQATTEWAPKRDAIKKVETAMAATVWRLNPKQLLTKIKQSESKQTEEIYDVTDIEDRERERLAAVGNNTPTRGEDMLKEFKLVSQTHQAGHTLFGVTREAVVHDPIQVLTNVDDVWELDEDNRVRLIQALLLQQYEDASIEFGVRLREYQGKSKMKSELEIQHKAEILRDFSVIGMTITGASINHQLLEQVKPAVVIVEEAAEVLEPQITATLGKWVQQLILIGDHKQLRPPVDSHVLKRDYSFDTSLMERLINNEFKYGALAMQNRMRPEFANLLLDIYPKLQSNLDRVGKNAPANCIQHSMYFWDHQHEETSGRSYTNEEEAKRAVQLALFLVQQGYKPTQITVLAAYQGQVALIRRMMRKAKENHRELFEEYESVKASTSETKTDSSRIEVQTIDMYQGDENDFVIVSLVRSNPKRDTGFVKVLNRRCVAQSRAKCGMYFIGNYLTLVSAYHWQNLLFQMRDLQLVGPTLPLHCPKHPEMSKLLARKAEDITLGCFCKVKCSLPMKCNRHICQATCQPAHSHEKCEQTVEFYFSKCGHPGERKCYIPEENLECRKKIRALLSCQHEVDCKCCDDPRSLSCLEPCSKTLPCKHPCQLLCSQPCNSAECEECKRIQKAEAELRKKQHEEHLKRVKEETEKLIEKMPKNLEEGVQKIELLPTGDTASEYYDVEDKVKKYIQPGHKWYPLVTKIEKVMNLQLEIKWLKRKLKLYDPSRSEKKFHGTTAEAADSIIREGFRMPKPNRQMYGPGIYFATDSSKSAQKIYTKGSNILLLCDVLLGKTKTVKSAEPEMTPQKLKSQKYDSLFAQRGSRNTGGVLYDEFVVYHSDQAIPRYVIHYRTADITKPDVAAELGKLEQTATKFARYQITSKRELKPDDPLEIHFRIAESQTLRLLKGTKKEIGSVDYYINPTLINKFNQKASEFSQLYGNAKEADYILAFHGTKLENITQIVKENFRLDKLATNTGNKGFYGAGIYFSEFPAVSLGYGQSILLCKVLPGKSYDCPSRMVGASLQQGFDSHRFKADTEGRGTELVIFDPDQILPCYVVNLQ